MAKPVYALVGVDAFLILQELAAIRQELGADVARVDVDGERADLADVLDELRSFALFGSGKLVVVRDADEFLKRFREQMEDYVAKPSSSATLVLRCNTLRKDMRITKAIAKVGEIRECNPPKNPVKWMIDRAKKAHGMTLSSDAAYTLSDLIGNDLGRLDNELAKLAIQSEGGKIDPRTIGGAVAFQREQEMWDLTDALSAGNATEALRRWRNLSHLDTSAEFRAVTWLTIWLENSRKALQLRTAGKPDNVIGNELRIWPMDKRPAFFKTVSAMGKAGVGRAIDLLAELDLHSKSGVGEASTNVEAFILAMGK